MTFVWLASYPKSGNTWLRILLSNYLSESGDGWRWDSPILGPPSHLERHEFDEAMGIASADMSDAGLDLLRRRLHAQFVSRFTGTSFTKTHEAFFSARDGLAMFPANAQSKAVYLVRNPLDIAASYAHHQNLPIDSVIDHLANPAAQVENSDTFFDEHIGNWSDHVEGWTQQDIIETLCIRYEDLLDDTFEIFSRIIRFCELEIQDDKVARTVTASSFERLRARERQSGFKALSDTSRPFFRTGRSGGWQTELTAKQSRRVYSDHGEMMQKFAYRARHDI
ncbi:sulfotransferase domain-containing protein [Erythrobacter sp. THAF29]|uniref:sulfotransferase domain-containing protein n=1 Tax=Erythrobacter sp. THAF29 TaxID=2587851 RepID=UPI001268509A|nr:sulfotransferase domain-containing protein [Erythrobacter sp. THAF29]QFT78504.1 Sulfotransferase domain protein [Erythrobacter sp. THAF29]